MELLQTETFNGETNIESDHVIMPLDNHGNYGYMGIFYIGSAGDECGDGGPQPIRMILDTGSANSWVVSSDAVDKDDGFSPFDPHKSCGHTFHEPAVEDRQNTKITFGSGYLRGWFVDDLVTIGNMESEDPHDRLALPEYTFGMVTEQTCF